MICDSCLNGHLLLWLQSEGGSEKEQTESSTSQNLDLGFPDDDDEPNNPEGKVKEKTLDHEVTGLNPAGGGIHLMTVRGCIAHSLSLSSFHRLSMTNNVERDIPYST